MKRKVTAALLSAAMIMSLAACGGTSSSSTSGSSTAAAGSEAAASSEATEATGELTTVYVVMNNFGNTQTDAGVAAVQDAINEIIKDQGIQISLTMLSSDSYAQQINLMLAGGEDLDVFSITPGTSSFATFSSNNSLLDLTPYLDTDAPDLKALIRQEYWDACTLNGKTLMVTTWDDKVTGNWFVMRKDILDKYNLTDQAREIDSIADIEAIFEVVHENEPDLKVLACGGSGNALTPSEILFGENSFADNETYDTLGDQAYQMGIIMDGSTTVEDLWETEGWKRNCEKMQEWYEKGYVDKDAPTTTDSGETLLKNNAAFSYFVNAEANCETAKTKACGQDVVAVQVGTVPVSGGRIRQFGYGVSATTKNPDAAVKWLNVLYTNADVANLLNYGIEGENYIVQDDGTLNYPDGITAESNSYNFNCAFVVGNYYLLKVWDGDSPTLREDAKAINDAASVSPYASFSWDNSAVSAEVSATSSVYDEYYKAITTGSVDVDTEIPKYVEKLKASGLDEIMQSKQEQLDAFLAQ